MSVSVLLVHGRDFEPAPEISLELAVDALRMGIGRDVPEKLVAFERCRKEHVYYGDLNAAVLRSQGKTYDEALDVGDRRNALVELARLNKRKKFERARYDQLPGKTPLKEFLADAAAPILGPMGLIGAVLARIAPEYAAYFDSGSEFRSSLQARLRTAIGAVFDRGDSLVVISHCLGSIAAYDCFWALAREQRSAGKIDVWVTTGSPLGNEAVKKELAGASHSGPERYPDNLITWCNVAAEDDFFCHDKRVSDDFAPMLAQRLISRIKDYRIYNLAMRYARSDPHCWLGYLAHPRIAAILAAELEAQAPV